MRKVKVFNDARYDIEKEISQWLDENPDVTIISINGTNYSEYELVTYVLYETKPEGMILS